MIPTLNDNINYYIYDVLNSDDIKMWTITRVIGTFKKF